MLRISNNDCFIEVEVSFENDPSIPSYGDAQLSIRVQSHGYIGSTTVWVEREQLQLFSEAIFRLENSLQGEAVLSSISPGELRLKLFTVSPCGHIALEGSIGNYRHCVNSTHWHSVTFGFEFENTQLTQANKVPWISMTRSPDLMNEVQDQVK